MCVTGKTPVPSYSFANTPGLELGVWGMVNQEFAVLKKRKKVNA